MNGLPEFEVILREHGPMIYTLAIRLSGNTADGEDLAQETFLKAYEKREQFRGEAEINTWLYRICVNLWKNRVRYERRRSFWKHLSLGFRGPDGDEGPALELADGEPPADHDLEKADDQARLHQALECLAPEERAIVTLRDMEAKSYEQIAELLDIPLGTVRSRLARSRDKLRRLFVEETPSVTRSVKNG